MDGKGYFQSKALNKNNIKIRKVKRGIMRRECKKQGQAALEFLTTYGWAFLVILIMIGSLAYFGILNPTKILPNRCNFGPEFECVDYQLSRTAGDVKIKMKNNAGDPIVVSSFTVSSESTTPLSCTAPVNIGAQNVWGTAEVRDFTLTSCNIAAVGFQAGEKEKVLINIKYYSVKSGSTYSHEINGEIFSTVI